LRASVFITQPVAHSAIERLRSIADVEWNPDPMHTLTKDELCAGVREHDILFCLLQDHVDRDVIAANPGLRAVASMKITPSDIDVARGDVAAHSRDRHSTGRDRGNRRLAFRAAAGRGPARR